MATQALENSPLPSVPRRQWPCKPWDFEGLKGTCDSSDWGQSVAPCLTLQEPLHGQVEDTWAFEAKPANWGGWRMSGWQQFLARGDYLRVGVCQEQVDGAQAGHSLLWLGSLFPCLWQLASSLRWCLGTH